jgi:4-hydroxy-tetrahydrodipicolinate reductase
VSVPVVVPGVAGRMGRLIARAALRDDTFELVAATARPGSDAVGSDVGVLAAGHAIGVLANPRLDDALGALDDDEHKGGVIIDFTTPDLCEVHAACAQRFGLGLIVGTTGLSAAAERALDEAAAQVPVLLASNCSVGANLLMAMVRASVAAVPDADVEIVEVHHAGKRDAPSGTALSLAQAAADGRGVALDDVLRTERAGEAPRKEGEIGVFGLRGGDVAGEHTVYLLLDGERIELTHRAGDRRIFAAGALRAARWLSGRAPGRYAMADVLELDLAGGA